MWAKIPFVFNDVYTFDALDTFSVKSMDHEGLNQKTQGGWGMRGITATVANAFPTYYGQQFGV